MLEKSFSESELVLALIGAVGTDLAKVRSILEDRLKLSGYQVEHVSITRDVIPQIVKLTPKNNENEYDRLMALMDAGNKARKNSEDNSILSLGAAGYIAGKRQKDNEGKPNYRSKHAYIISSLKHPEEVVRLRAIYPQGFYLLGVHSDEDRRLSYLVEDKGIDEKNAKALISRDEDEHIDYGQRVTDTFHLSDFFVRTDHDEDRLKNSIWRLLRLLFGHPYITPTFDEYSMFMAFTASLRSADLSRQVGAVIAINEQVVATGANDCPKAGGGQYWAKADKLPEEVSFPDDGRDFARGYDSNKKEKSRIVNEILLQAEKEGIDKEKLEAMLKSSRIQDLTEFGRVVHAEMDALLSCARSRLPIKGGILYSTTFPCHNCAKHIIAAGIDRVVFIEPYTKSKAIEFHSDSIKVGFIDSEEDKGIQPKVHFEPFVGVGPRRFFDLFSLRLGSGYPVKRKDKAGASLKFNAGNGRLRLQMLPASYLDLEYIASNMFRDVLEAQSQKENEDGA